MPNTTDSATSVLNFPSWRSIVPNSETTWRAINRAAALASFPDFRSFLVSNPALHSSGGTASTETSPLVSAQASRKTGSPPSIAICVIRNGFRVASIALSEESLHSNSQSSTMSRATWGNVSRSKWNCSYRSNWPWLLYIETPDRSPRSTAKSSWPTPWSEKSLSSKNDISASWIIISRSSIDRTSHVSSLVSTLTRTGPWLIWLARPGFALLALIMMVSLPFPNRFRVIPRPSWIWPQNHTLGGRSDDIPYTTLFKKALPAWRPLRHLSSSLWGGTWVARTSHSVGIPPEAASIRALP